MFDENDNAERKEFLYFNPGSKAAQLWAIMCQNEQIVMDGGGRTIEGSRLAYDQRTIRECEKWLATTKPDDAPKQTFDDVRALLQDTKDKIKFEILPAIEKAQAEYDRVRAEYLLIRSTVDRGLQVTDQEAGFLLGKWPEFSDDVMALDLAQLESLALAGTGISLAEHAIRIQAHRPVSATAMHLLQQNGRY